MTIPNFNHQCIVIGGGNSSLYGPNFYVIGNHNTSNYGCGLDWNTYSFWNKLDTMLNNHLFNCIIIDNGSLSWMSNINIDGFRLIITKYLSYDGIFINEGPGARIKENEKI